MKIFTEIIATSVREDTKYIIILLAMLLFRRWFVSGPVLDDGVIDNNLNYASNGIVRVLFQLPHFSIAVHGASFRLPPLTTKIDHHHDWLLDFVKFRFNLFDALPATNTNTDEIE